MLKLRTRLMALSLFALTPVAALAQQSVQPPAAPAVPSSPNNSASPSHTQASPTQTQQTPNSGQLPATGVQSSRQSVVVKKPAMEGQGKDHMIASMLSLCNQKEVQLGTIAKQHTTSSHVKEFADMMIRDHGEMVSSLQQFGGRNLNLSVESNTTGSQTSVDTRSGRDAHNTTGNAQQNNTNPANTTATVTTENSNGHSLPHATAAGFDVFDIHREIAQKCLSEAKSEWAKNDPKENDMQYVGQQIVAHKEMIVTGKVLRNHASPELQKAIDRGIATAEGHLEEAHKLIKKLGSEKTDSTTSSKD